ncbi:SDR family oxidoreductase [Brucella intermedia]|uniref:SDR family oxidoreductase n=1 Tax=Brucella intermedia TaxID=94625 RepID=UPI00158FEA28|nr:SDR family oxidoreductase [Brucella intermedia]
MSQNSPELNANSGKIVPGTVWITGAGSGIGAAMARRFAREGWRVALTGRKADALTAIAGEIAVNGGEARIFPADVLDRETIAATAGAIVEWAGRLDVLCNNAGLNIPLRSWADIDFDSWGDVIDINIKGAINVIAAALTPMRAQGGGLMIHTSSWAGRFSSPGGGVPYGASKHALNDLSASLNAQEGQNGIRSTVLCPGEVATPLLARRPGFDLSRMDEVIQPEDMAETALYVANMNPKVTIHEIVLAPTKK